MNRKSAGLSGAPDRSRGALAMQAVAGYAFSEYADGRPARMDGRRRWAAGADGALPSRDSRLIYSNICSIMTV